MKEMCKIKCFIFDQDGTLYSTNSTLFLYIRKKTKEWISKKLNLSKDEIDKLYKELIIEYPNPFLGFMSLGATVSEYHSEVFDKIDPNDFLSNDKDLIKILNNIKKHKYIVTMASKDYSQKLQKCLGIGDLYIKTFYVKDFEIEYSKKICIELIKKNHNLKYNEICVVGDSFEMDVLPAVELGCKTIYITNKEIDNQNILTIPTIYDLQKILECKLGENKYEL